MGQFQYPRVHALSILAVSGGSNRYRARPYKYFLQHILATPFNPKVTVAHNPRGASKWNSTEHSLSSELAKNWTDLPLESMDIILNYMRTTNTQTRLTVTAKSIQRDHEKGTKVSDEQMTQLTENRILKSHSGIIL